MCPFIQQSRDAPTQMVKGRAQDESAHTARTWLHTQTPDYVLNKPGSQLRVWKVILTISQSDSPWWTQYEPLNEAKTLWLPLSVKLNNEWLICSVQKRNECLLVSSLCVELISVQYQTFCNFGWEKAHFPKCQTQPFKSQTSSPLPADGNIKTQKLHRLMNKMFLSFFFFF